MFKKLIKILSGDFSSKEEKTKEEKIEKIKRPLLKPPTHADKYITFDDLDPNLGPYVITKVYKNPGDHVKKDEIVFDLETDKIVIEFPAKRNGILTEINFEEGDEIIPSEWVFTINQI